MKILRYLCLGVAKFLFIFSVLFFMLSLCASFVLENGISNLLTSALPNFGESIQHKEIYINEEEIVSEYITESIEEAGIAQDEILLGADEYFVLGDNLGNSEDSRFANIGNVNKQDIEGKVWFRVSPFKEMGFIK